MGEWNALRLDTAITIKHGFAFKGEYFSESGPGPLLVTPGNFSIGGGFKFGKPKYYLGDIPDGFQMAPGDLIVTMTDLSKSGDTLGYPALVPDGARFLHNQRIGLVEIKNRNLLDARFLYFALRTARYHDHVLATATGSTVRHTSPSRICDYMLPVPDIDGQRTIAAVLGALDDKIAVNERIACHLDEIMTAHFAIATRRAQHQTKLGEIISLRYGKALTEGNRTPGQIPIYGGNGISGWHDAALVNRPGVIVGRKGANAGSVSWSQVPFWPIDTAFYVESLPGRASDEFIYFLLRSLQLQRLVGDSAIPGLNRETALSCEAPLPDDDVIERFTTTAQNALALQMQVSNESNTLADLRDTLLPKLMSGELRVREAEEIVGDAV